MVVVVVVGVVVDNEEPSVVVVGVVLVEVHNVDVKKVMAPVSVKP
jgi:hypothetical protein